VPTPDPCAGKEGSFQCPCRADSSCDNPDQLYCIGGKCLFCTDCTVTGKDGEKCRTSAHPDFESKGQCDAGLVCGENERCAPPAQPTPVPTPVPASGCAAGNGNLDCPCINSACNVPSLRCNAAGICVTCLAETLGCPCGPNDSCIAGAQCTAGLCVGCQPGTKDCPCGADMACDGSLACYIGKCIDTCDFPGEAKCCVPGKAGCICNNGACIDAGFGCDLNGLCTAGVSSPCDVSWLCMCANN
jgi:hypothetical protein